MYVTCILMYVCMHVCMHAYNVCKYNNDNSKTTLFSVNNVERGECLFVRTRQRERSPQCSLEFHWLINVCLNV